MCSVLALCHCHRFGLSPFLYVAARSSQNLYNWDAEHYRALEAGFSFSLRSQPGWRSLEAIHKDQFRDLACF